MDLGRTGRAPALGQLPRPLCWSISPWPAHAASAARHSVPSGEAAISDMRPYLMRHPPLPHWADISFQPLQPLWARHRAIGRSPSPHKEGTGGGTIIGFGGGVMAYWPVDRRPRYGAGYTPCADCGPRRPASSSLRRGPWPPRPRSADGHRLARAATRRGGRVRRRGCAASVGTGRGGTASRACAAARRARADLEIRQPRMGLRERCAAGRVRHVRNTQHLTHAASSRPKNGRCSRAVYGSIGRAGARPNPLQGGWAVGGADGVL
jgi:hypothetical protein